MIKIKNMPTSCLDYDLFFKFIETFAPTGFMEINPDDSRLIELENSLKNKDQFFFVGDVIQMKILFTGKGSTKMIGIPPADVTAYLFLELTHPDDLERFSLGRAKVFKLAQDLYIAGKGSTLFSSNIRILCADGKYKCMLFQCYLFYSETPIKTVYVFQVHTDIDKYKKHKNGCHYYSGTDFSIFKFPDEELLQIGNIYTKREFEIIKLIELGLSSEQIAEKIFVSLNTVNVHRGNILKKSGKTRVSELIYDLMEQGIL